MSNKWILIKLADEFGLQIYENKIFGQLKSTNQLVKIESGQTSPIFSVAYKLSPNLNTEKLNQSIQQFNKRRWGKVLIEDNLLCVGNIQGTLTNPKKQLEKLHEIISWWNEELSKFQHFDKYPKVALYKTGPDKDETGIEENIKLQIERDKASTDNRQGLMRGVSLSVFYAIAIGVVAGILRKYKISVFPLEMIFTLGLVGKSFKKEGKSFNLKSLVLISSVFLAAFLLEQFVRLCTYYYLIGKLDIDIDSVVGVYFEILVKNYKWFLWPVFIVLLLLIPKFVEHKSPDVVRGRDIDDIDRSLGEIYLKKMRISLYSFFTIFLFFIPMFLQIIYIFHDVVYPSQTVQFILFTLLIPLCFYGNYRITKKVIGRSPFMRHEREAKFEVFEDNLGRFITSFFMAATIALTVSFLNVMLDPFESRKIDAILNKDYPVKIRSCVTLPLKLSEAHEEDFSFCDDIRNPPKAGSKLHVLEGQGLFGMKYYKKVIPQILEK